MVSRAVTQLYDDVLRPSDLRVTQFSILATIARLGKANLRQLEDMLAIDQTTLTRSLNLLERDGVIERVPHPDRRIKAMKLTSKGRRALEAARLLWFQVQDKVHTWNHSRRAASTALLPLEVSFIALMRRSGTKARADAQRRLAHLLRVAVKRRGPSRGRVQPSPARRGTGLVAGRRS